MWITREFCWPANFGGAGEWLAFQPSQPGELSVVEVLVKPISRFITPILLAALAACGGGAPGSVDTAEQDLTTENGMTTNGMTTNGLTTNGMTTNGMTTNGLLIGDPNGNALPVNGFGSGFATSQFKSWFSRDPGYADMVMKYVARCALPAGTARAFSFSGTGYTFNGAFGLAPVWASGLPIPLVEQQLVSGCLAAHVNKYGVHVQISMLGFTSDGGQIALDAGELSTFSVREGCFYGNLFNGGNIYVSADRDILNPNTTSVRGCAIEQGSSGCLPLINTGDTCQKRCSNRSGAAYSTWGNCTAPDGLSYAAMNTRLKPSDVYQCGDGICQLTESCSTGSNKDACLQDCGYCK